VILATHCTAGEMVFESSHVLPMICLEIASCSSDQYDDSLGHVTEDVIKNDPRISVAQYVFARSALRLFCLQLLKAGDLDVTGHVDRIEDP